MEFFLSKIRAVELFGLRNDDLPSISSTLNAQILCMKVLFSSFFYLHVTAKKKFVLKMCADNVDEIDI